MKTDRYEQASRRTWRPEPPDEPLGHVLDVYYNAAQLSSEAGEVAGMIAKWIKFGKQLDKDALKLELGDAIWHITRLAEMFGWSLDEIMRANIAKLEARHPDGQPDTYYVGISSTNGSTTTTVGHINITDLTTGYIYVDDDDYIKVTP